MDCNQNRRNGRNFPRFIQQLVVADPWMAMTLLSLLTEHQWAALLTMAAMEDLREHVEKQVNRVLEGYPRVLTKWRDDIVQDVLMHLSEGRFWKNYQPAKKHPAAYMIGSAFQYARTVARSYWRRFGRDAA